MIHGIDTSFLVAAELASHSRHAAARQLLQSLHQAGDQFALAPQVLAEFVHIVTDPRRCANPLMIDEALDRAEQLWNATKQFKSFLAPMKWTPKTGQMAKIESAVVPGGRVPQAPWDFGGMAGQKKDVI